MNELEEKRSTYPRVSEIIVKQNANEFRNVNIDVLANACIRGDKVHDYCTTWALDLWVGEIEPEYKPYFDAFTHWWRQNVESLLHYEMRLYDDVKRFSGKFDMIVKMKNEKVLLIDLKTSCAKSKTWPVQLAAYTHLCKLNGLEIEGVMNLHLKKIKPAQYEEKNGEKVMTSPPQVKACTLNEHEDVTPYWDIFSSALACYDYFDRKEIK